MTTLPPPTPLIPGYAVTSDTTAPDGTRTLVYKPLVPPPTIRVRVADAVTLIPVCDLTDGCTVDLTGRGLLVDSIPGVAALRFVVDGLLLPRVEANPPLAVWGDAGGHLLPHGLTPGVHTLEVDGYSTVATAQAAAFGRVVSAAYRFIVSATPTPTPTPSPSTLPTLKRMVAPLVNRPRFGVGLTSGGPQVLADTHVEGFATNISLEGVASVDVRNVRSVDAYRDDPAWSFGGQGLYVDKVKGPVTVAGYFAGWNGWQPDKPPTDRSMFRHAGYFNFDASPPAVSDWLAVGQPASGGLFRNSGSMTRFAILDCGIGIEGSQGVVTLTDGLIYGSNFYADFAVDANGKVTGVKAWTGMIGVSSDAVVRLKNVLIVARPGQELGDGPVQGHVKATGAHRYFGPCLSANYKASDPGHPGWLPPPRGVDQITCENVHVYGWPGGRTNLFGGNGQQSRAGVTWHDAPVSYDYMRVISQVFGNTLSVPDAVAKIRADVAALAK